MSIQSLRQPRSTSEHTRDEPRAGFFYFGEDRESCDKFIEGPVLYEQTTSYGGFRRYAQDLAAALPRKHMDRVRLAHECVSLVHVNVADCPEIDVDRLHERTGAHVVQESLLGVRAYERRVRESVRGRVLMGLQQRPPELPTGRILMVHRGGAGGRVHLLAVRRRMGGDLAFCGEVAGQTPDFLFPVKAVENEIPIVVLAVGRKADVRLQATD